MRLLLIEDSVRLRELLTERVHDAGWRLDAVATARTAESAAKSVAYDLVLLDLGLPDGDGITLIRALRKGGFAAPILVITARGSIDDRVTALDSGADDYLVKPFNHTELLARCRALMRRRGSTVVELFEVGDISFDPASGIVRIGSEALPISPRERSVLELLLRNAGRVVAKQQIEVALSESSGEISTNAVELAVSRLRRRLAASPSGTAIETIRGVGYLLREAQHNG